ncbi:motility protein B [mine drainage metagenome]|uniref:Motility protein B n=1 Tax=mine drainage metagenome TaxID=410659 RepID=A0A1J5S4J1_9ZZZZ
MNRRKLIEDDHENHERWLVSYADFITLLFAFFVVMYSISSVNTGKYNQLSTSIGHAFSGITLYDTKHSLNTESKLKSQQRSLIKPLPLTHIYNEKMRREREAMTSMGINLSNTLAPLISDGKIRVVQNNRGIRIDIHDSLLFNAGSANLADAANNVINQIAAEIKDSRNMIQVEGHTDNTPIHNAEFFSNWELSAMRATSVVRLLSNDGITESRLGAIGYGSAQPTSENITALGRAKNRRVSIMVLYETQDPQDSAVEITPQNKTKPN